MMRASSVEKKLISDFHLKHSAFVYHQRPVMLQFAASEVVASAAGTHFIPTPYPRANHDRSVASPSGRLEGPKLKARSYVEVTKRLYINRSPLNFYCSGRKASYLPPALYPTASSAGAIAWRLAKAPPTSTGIIVNMTRAASGGKYIILFLYFIYTPDYHPGAVASLPIAIGITGVGARAERPLRAVALARRGRV